LSVTRKIASQLPWMRYGWLIPTFTLFSNADWGKGNETSESLGNLKVEA
jgi:hypothetical protein